MSNQQYNIQNLKYGFVFAADKDMKDNDHIVEARPGTSESDKGQEKFIFALVPQKLGYYQIQNKKYGYIFAANSDTDDGDHLVEAHPNFEDDDKNRWSIIEVPGTDYCYIRNWKHGYMFAADSTKKDGDHVVECRPNTKEDDLNQDKFRFRLCKQ